jgi:hypothetical protein
MEVVGVIYHVRYSQLASNSGHLGRKPGIFDCVDFHDLNKVSLKVRLHYPTDGGDPPTSF